MSPEERKDAMKKLIYGMGLTGVSTAKTLIKMGISCLAYDEKIEEEEGFYQLDNGDKVPCINKISDIDWEEIDQVIKSPGIRRDKDLLREADKRGIEVVSDLELVTRLFPDEKVVAITGTNGKTSTSSLLGHILNENGIKARVIGNIGLGMLWEIYSGERGTINIIECSSFQLEDTKYFKPYSAGILNITPDHLDYHGSFENYIRAKLKIINNLEGSLVMNMDDPVSVENIGLDYKNLYQISMTKIPKRGAYSDGYDLFLVDGKEMTQVISSSELLIMGRHNQQNAMMAICLAKDLGLNRDQINKGLKSFKGVPHRIEFVRDYKGVSYYNDSKGTNVDATIVAIKAMRGKTICIMGGYDKKVDLNPLFEAMGNKVVHLLLLGQTASLFKELADRYEIPSEIVNDMEEAVLKARDLASPGMSVLLSPASASWGMYNNFEERGDDFKRIVMEDLDG